MSVPRLGQAVGLPSHAHVSRPVILSCLLSSALRSIVAVRAFGGKLLGGKGAAALAAPAEGEESPSEVPAEKAAPEVNLPGVTEPSLKLLIDYIYTAKLEVTDDNWPGVLLASDKLGLDGAKRAVERHFAQPGKLIASNASSVLAAAEQHKAVGLRDLCLSIMDADWAGSASAEGFTSLPKPILMELLVSPRLAALGAGLCTGNIMHLRAASTITVHLGDALRPCSAATAKLDTPAPQARDTIRAPELAIFHATIAWGKARLKEAPASAPAEPSPEGDAAAAEPKQPTLDEVSTPPCTV